MNFTLQDCEALWELAVNEHRYTPQVGERVLDIGASYGWFSLYCSTRGALVSAYEPDPDAFEHLVEQVHVSQKCGGTAIVPYKAGVWSEEGQRLLWRRENHIANSMLRPSDNSVLVRTVSLTQALAGKKWNCVKCDAEGAEGQIFLTAKREDFALIGYLTMELHSDVLTLDQNNALMNRLRREFPKVVDVPEVREGLPTGRTAKVFCWGVV
jgi:FkbM family methyltransferase